MTTETNTQQPVNFRQALETRLAQQDASGLHGEIRHTDHAFSNEVRFDPAEFDRAPPGTPLDGATDLNGVPIGYSKALEADASQVLVYHNGLPLRLSQALELNLCTKAQLGQGRQQTSGNTSTTNAPQVAEVDPEVTAEAAEHQAAVDALRAPLWDAEDLSNLTALQDAAARSGFSMTAVARDLLADTAEGATTTLEALANATGHPVEHIAEVLQEMNDHVVGQLVSLAGEEAVAEAMAAPGWKQAALAMIESGSLLPGARFIAQNVERQSARG